LRLLLIYNFQWKMLVFTGNHNFIEVAIREKLLLKVELEKNLTLNKF